MTDAALTPPVETVDVQPVNKKGRRALHKKRSKIYPKRARGSFRRFKWILMAITLTIYYVTPWLRWDRGVNAPDQAVLLDLPARRFYFFFIEIWPQEVFFITGLLILAAMGLFLTAATVGRAWCGYACPQTVWTDLFVAVERFWEGDRNARMRLDRASWGMAKIGRKVSKHVSWLLIAVATGGAWVFYFADAPGLAVKLVNLEAAMPTYVWIGLLTVFTYLFGGHAREAVCTYMCPWPRIQAALADEETLIVNFDASRGEPRGSHKANQSWEGRGDCVDCNQCVAVCPMGIDIRDGLQLECISCALCIDACNEVMDKVGRPPNLISYGTLNMADEAARGETPKFKLFRGRTFLYSGMIILVAAIMVYALASRPIVDVSVQHERSPLFTTMSDGSVRNAYTIKITNKKHENRQFELSVVGLNGADISRVGGDDGLPVFTVGPDTIDAFHVFVTVSRDRVVPSRDLEFVVTDTGSGDVARTDSRFKGPSR
ncbi:MAG: cytochrome c oxidase accessory protein CcoG [Rhodospirillaceae bacterium]|jgi:cytochrome c oxidase accessory protein FixG|nr:cytochrome c oxidase accessory protein CcoG [Rhodospirillaceae bacterium]MBT4771042.1 cytochrome c oxidase accessory protein CcoG [Rhodospirillaceae bacterium]MBT5357667.1 cytochrome c oxidase accessory protein CcoG [Rhodospirillaceae bacterium]MBT5768901.1 cytochrome c oxidase accessory protein CcoG [Rhodospirillaceae bacterium]MBT6308953.1 cytochrome c oxidase accessory protein CcoG [Rhodospirillaceae bacterium]